MKRSCLITLVLGISFYWSCAAGPELRQAEGFPPRDNSLPIPHDRPMADKIGGQDVGVGFVTSEVKYLPVSWTVFGHTGVVEVECHHQKYRAFARQGQNMKVGDKVQLTSTRVRSSAKSTVNGEKVFDYQVFYTFYGLPLSEGRLL